MIKEDPKPNFDWSSIRERFARVFQNRPWKSLDEIADTQEFNDFLNREYPYEAANFQEPVDRREFLKLMGASLVMAGLAGCQANREEKIVPYVKSPEEMIPGKPLFYATSMPFQGAAVGLIVESNMGRPTKLDGNPDHPDSLGATHIFHHGSILELYDPDRSKTVLHNGKPSTWESFQTDFAIDLAQQASKQGAGIRILTGAFSSPLLKDQFNKFQKAFPAAKHISYESISKDGARRAQKLSFGEYYDPLYDFSKANVILSLDSDFLFALPGSIKYARDFAGRRQVTEAKTTMNRLYMVESSVSITGSSADHRLSLSPSEIPGFAAAVAARLGVQIDGYREVLSQNIPKLWVETVANELKLHRSKGLVIAGDGQPAVVHSLAYAMNQILGNFGKTISFISPIEAKPSEYNLAAQELIGDIELGRVELLIVLESNPAYTMPRDLQFEKYFQKVPKRIHLGLQVDETAVLSHWHIPAAHYLETFSDALASDGTVSTIQPLIAPLYNGRSVHEIMALAIGQPGQKPYDLLKDFWRSKFPEATFEKDFRRMIHNGFLAKSASSKKSVSAKTRLTSADLKKLGGNLQLPANAGLEAVFNPDPSLWDGRFANVSWLQELPKPLTKLTWDNPALISPRLAQDKGLSNGDIVTLKYGEDNLIIPVWITPGQNENTISLFLGSGRISGGQIQNGIGFNVNTIRLSNSPYSISNLTLIKSGNKFSLSCTQNHNSMEGRDLVRHATLEEFKHHPDFAQHHAHGKPADFYPHWENPDYSWAMSINLNACIGCNSCVIACQSENNIPVVGKQEVIKGREMHWMRIDRYYEGDLDQPEVHNQPMLCMHCEKAPCEPVCPVGATVHDEDGLNVMVYNRCVGTKYCGNNCPYKVRRFNFFGYADQNTESLKLMRNPNVTVRSRGVMEKCTFCIQRIQKAKIEADKADRKIQDGEIVTACQTACPTGAIVFGDIKNPESKVSKLKALPLNYGLLTELNTFPRVTYLAKITNPNPKLKGLSHV